MKSSKLRLEHIAAPGNLREAFLRAARGKSHRPDVRAFRENLGAELASLRAGLLDGGVRVGECTAFTIWEPKERRIHAPCFRERVLHHALIGPCEGDFERWLIPDTYACRRGRGREAALRRAEQFARRHAWFLKLDVRKYFDSIPHGPLLAEISRRFRDARVVALWQRIVAAYATAPGRGLPIGALTSQHLANFYLSRLDHFVKEELKLPGYVRYMDDMALWCDDRDELKSAHRRVAALLAADFGLAFKDTWHLQPAARGMAFLGYRVFPGGSTLARASRRRLVRRLRARERELAAGSISEAAAQRRVLALTAFVRPAWREKILRRLFGENSGTGYRAPTASTAAAVGITTPPTAAPPTATGTSQATATTTSASASPSAHARPGRAVGLNRPVSGSGRLGDRTNPAQRRPERVGEPAEPAAESPGRRDVPALRLAPELP
jgi:RNA-directed DNA polymerase